LGGGNHAGITKLPTGRIRIPAVNERIRINAKEKGVRKVGKETRKLEAHPS